MKNKLKIHLWTLGRFFALPFFGAALLLGVVLGGGSLRSLDTWLCFLAGMLVMAGGHSWNTYLDTIVTKLDAGAEHSVEKDYSAGSIVISEGWASKNEVLINACA